ncbi:MAG: NRDE family protein [Pseudomonadota bacterium]
MCLISLAIQTHADYPLLVVANRDEYHARPTAEATFWEQYPQLLAGRDLIAGGTWLGITRDGRFAAITNHRNPPDTPANPRSRGMLTLDFLIGTATPTQYLADLAAEAHQYAGFNLLVGNVGEVAYFSNIEKQVRTLMPGVYSLSNGLLDSNWPKQRLARESLSRLLQETLDHEAMAATLSDPHPAPDQQLPDTGVGLEQERALSSAFSNVPGYGTRATTTLSISTQGEVRMREQRFAEGGLPAGVGDFSFRLGGHE